MEVAAQCEPSMEKPDGSCDYSDEAKADNVAYCDAHPSQCDVGQIPEDKVGAGRDYRDVMDTCGK